MVVDDPRFDLGDHLRHAVLPEPGGPEELDTACAQLASQRLGRGRPLWRITLIDGLADGREAIVLEVHHALMDEFATRTTLARIFSREGPPSSLSALNQGFTSARRFARACLPLESVLVVKDIASVTVNDVALANVPVGMEEPGAAPGLSFSSPTTSLATDVADPWERFRRISVVTAEAKAYLDLAGRELLADWLETRLDANVVVSNLRGHRTCHRWV